MDLNTIILGGLNLVLGAFSSLLWASFQDVKKKAESVGRELADYRVHCAERFITADEMKSVVHEINASFEKYGNRIDASLLRIESKLDSKQDK